MPSARLTMLLAALVLAGFGFVFLFEGRLESTEDLHANEGRILRLAPDEVRRLKVRRDAWTSALIERVDAHAFRLVEPVEGAADSAAVMRLLSGLEFLKTRADLQDGADEGQRHAYGLSPAALEIDLELDEGREIHLALGAAAPVGGGVYLSVGGQSAVQVVDARLLAQESALLDRSVGAGQSGAGEKEQER
jgi:hypothetical protein